VLALRYARISLGIDIGGTFTDLVVHDHDSGQRYSRKVLTTHQDIDNRRPHFVRRGDTILLGTAGGGYRDPASREPTGRGKTG